MKQMFVRLLLEIVEAIIQDVANDFWDDLGTDKKDILAAVWPQAFFETSDQSRYEETVIVDEVLPGGEDPNSNMADGIHLSAGNLTPGCQGMKLIISNLEAVKTTSAWHSFVSLFLTKLVLQDESSINED